MIKYRLLQLFSGKFKVEKKRLGLIGFLSGWEYVGFADNLDDVNRVINEDRGYEVVKVIAIDFEDE